MVINSGDSSIYKGIILTFCISAICEKRDMFSGPKIKMTNEGGGVGGVMCVCLCACFLFPKMGSTFSMHDKFYDLG